MKKGWILGVLMLITNHASGATLGTEACDELYSHRGSDSLQAYQCYLPLLKDPEKASIQKDIYQRMFIALSAVINDLPKTTYEKTAISNGLSLVNDYNSVYGANADYYYWKSCFVSFDVLEKDRGAIIPTHMFGVLGTLQDLLQSAIKLDPSVHFYGPMRVLGMMHTQMPMIVGGDKTLAEKMLREAYAKMPLFSINNLAFAKILDVNGKSAEAIKVLNQFLSTPNEAFNPYPEQPLLNLLPETLKDKAEAQKLLNDINE